MPPPYVPSAHARAVASALTPDEEGVLKLLLGPFPLVEPNPAQARALVTLRERGPVSVEGGSTRAGRAICRAGLIDRA